MIQTEVPFMAQVYPLQKSSINYVGLPGSYQRFIGYRAF